MTAHEGPADALLAPVLRQGLLLEAANVARRGRLAAAATLLLDAARNEEGPAVLDLLARIRAQQGNYLEAERLWARLLALDPQHAGATSGLARIRASRGYPMPVAMLSVAAAAVAGAIILGNWAVDRVTTDQARALAKALDATATLSAQLRAANDSMAQRTDTVAQKIAGIQAQLAADRAEQQAYQRQVGARQAELAGGFAALGKTQAALRGDVAMLQHGQASLADLQAAAEARGNSQLAALRDGLTAAIASRASADDVHAGNVALGNAVTDAMKQVDDLHRQAAGLAAAVASRASADDVRADNLALRNSVTDATKQVDDLHRQVAGLAAVVASRASADELHANEASLRDAITKAAKQMHQDIDGLNIAVASRASADAVRADTVSLHDAIGETAKQLELVRQDIEARGRPRARVGAAKPSH